MTLAANPILPAYLIGAVGIFVEWRSYYLQGEDEFRRWSALGALLWALQYVLLGAWTAGLSMAVTALRTLLSGLHPKKLFKHASVVGFVVIFAGLTHLSWQGYMSLLPAFAVSNTTLALYYFNNRAMRIALLASSAAWIINDVYWQAWPALIAESVAIGINIRTIRKILIE
ncbi:MAG: YgjV family protein [Methylomonas sp.]|uniref:YgjV family protein n=1 Tax=Methylomonas sp. TaxID=418 RepID=UPI0025CF4F7F|nr:YgjV family protein [Methylomonas sp.]MCK9605614.1 YgjV family protein [Methylomonas sp.]